MTDAFYITTPIYYVNAEPHLGHAYTTIVADVAARFHRLLGHPVRFQTGTDEHGDKIAMAAAAEGVDPKEYTDRVSSLFRELWPQLDISYDRFVRTTDEDHKSLVREVLQRVYDAGDIYHAKYGGKYCVGCERYYSDRELVDGKCPDHQTEPTYVEEENYFFRMSKYQDALLQQLEKQPDFIRPERYRNEVRSFLQEPLEDLCISRPKSRLEWGIELPFDDRYVTYVWFDALINYVTGLGDPGGETAKTFWPATEHLIAKDILKPHGIYWPTMLLAAGIPLYRHLNVHGYWNVDESKMSKSLGNVVRPLDLATVYGVDAFRYFLLREMSFGLDSSFSEELLTKRYNSDLANDLGNLFKRTLDMLHRYREGKLPDAPQSDADDSQLDELSAEVTHLYKKHMEDFAFHKALAELWRLIKGANRYIVEHEPWNLARDPEKTNRLDAVLRNLANALVRVTVMIAPVMPKKAADMAEKLGISQMLEQKPLAQEAQLELVPGTSIGENTPLFPRIESQKKKEKQAKTHSKSSKKKSGKDEKPAEITIDDFARLDLRVGTVLNAEHVQGADKLLRLQVDIGETGEPRTVVAGIARYYAPRDLVGQQVVVVANLKPVTLRGVLSRGMVLAASDGDGALALVSPLAQLRPGSRVK